MNIFLKATAGVLIALILWLCLEKRGKDISLLLIMAVCAMVVTSATTFLNPILDFIDKIQEIGNVDNEYVTVVLKIVGIGIVTEISVLICKDAGNESLGKTLQILSTVVVLWISIPVFDKLLELINEILVAA